MAANIELRKAVGEVVKALRFEAGMTQTDLAKESGLIGQNWFVSKLETAKWSDHRMWSTLRKVAPSLKTTPEAIAHVAHRLVSGVELPDEAGKRRRIIVEMVERAAGRGEAPPIEYGPPDMENIAEAADGDGVVDMETLDLCIKYTESHLLSRLEAEAEELDPFEVHALSVALYHLEALRGRRVSRR